MIIIILGPQASGKDTQGLKLQKEFNIPLIPVGDLLRKLPEDHPEYKNVRKAMNAGELVDYAVTAKVIKDRLSLPDCANGYILDGWGRIIEQFDFFDPDVDLAIYLNIPRAESLRRISGRRICEPTGEIVNILTMTPEEIEACPGPLVQREDDKEEAVNRRLDIFEKETKPVIEWYRNQGKLIEVDGTKDPEGVFAEIMAKIKQ